MTNYPYKPWLMIKCRSLGEFKSNVRNKVAHEGYIATELVTFCARYLDNAPTFLNRPLRNPDTERGGNASEPQLYDIDTNSLIHCV
jgi:hypothetical protein